MKRLTLLETRFGEVKITESSEAEPQKVEQKVKQENPGVMIPTEVFEAFMKVVNKITTDNAATNLDTNLLANAIVDGFAQREGNRNGVVNRRTYTKDNLPYDDLLEKPVMFFAFCNTTIIFDDVHKGGLTVNAPHHPIVFNPFLRYEQPGQKGKIITQCMAMVWSKSQVEFIRKHTLFSIEYFEKLSDSTNYSTDLMDKVVAAYDRVKHLNEFQVKQRCMELNIKIDTQDFKVLRKKIAHKMAQELQKDEDTIRFQEVEDSNISQQIRNKESTLSSKTYQVEKTY